MKNLFKKYFIFIFIIFFLSIFSFFEGKDYLDFYKNTQETQNQKQNLKTWIENFSLDKIRYLEQVDFYYTPYKNLLDNIVSKIDNANTRVYLEVYMLTESRIQEALIKAEKRWIDVKVVLEKNPYMSYNINNKAYDNLDNAWVFTMWSNTKNFSLNHAKFLIIDDEVIISTWNLTYSTFSSNRDLFLEIKDHIILEKMLSIFESDFDWNLTYIYDDNLVVSPDYSRAKFEKIFKEAEFSIDMYFQYLKDDSMFDLLLEKAKSWVKINIILAETALEDNKEEISKLETFWVKIKLIKSPKIHSKAILIDDKYLFIWSVNFSTYSFDKNREIWIILKDKNIIEKFKTVFKKDILN